MRCIEIGFADYFLIVREQINSNMRCIEIIDTYFQDKQLFQINSNMRCIEIKVYKDKNFNTFDKQ